MLVAFFHKAVKTAEKTWIRWNPSLLIATYLEFSELEKRRGKDNNSEIIFLISQ